MNTNKIYFIQTENVKTKKRQCWVVSSPSQEEAETYLPEAGWTSLEDDIQISSERVINTGDTNEMMSGLTYIKMHN